jgi:hypothetical protein
MDYCFPHAKRLAEELSYPFRPAFFHRVSSPLFVAAALIIVISAIKHA